MCVNGMCVWIVSHHNMTSHCASSMKPTLWLFYKALPLWYVKVEVLWQTGTGQGRLNPDRHIVYERSPFKQKFQKQACMIWLYLKWMRGQMIRRKFEKDNARPHSAHAATVWLCRHRVCFTGLPAVQTCPLLEKYDTSWRGELDNSDCRLWNSWSLVFSRIYKYSTYKPASVRIKWWLKCN